MGLRSGTGVLLSSVAGNGTLIYGSYLSKEADVPESARTVAFFDSMAAILSALVIIPAMATAGETLTQSGPGLMFIYLPNLFREMPEAGSSWRCSLWRRCSPG